MEDVELIGSSPFAWSLVSLQTGLKNNDTMYKTVSTSGKRVSTGAIYDEGRKTGVLSSALDATSTIANAFSHVPGLSTIGGAADWFLRSASGAAQAFGFSKPVVEVHPSRHVRTSYAGEGQTDMPTVAYALAPFQSNKLAIDGSVGCNDMDEMALDYVLSKYSYIFRGELTTTQSTGDIVYLAHVTPSCFWYRDKALSVVGANGNLALKTANTATENAFYPSTLCYIGDNFRYWRGNLKFRVTVACTKLHGGRVAFNFVPYRNPPVNNTPISNSAVIPSTSGVGPTLTGYSTVFDLQDATVFEYEVPFIYPAAYCPVLEGYIGDVSMIVVNPLTANATVPTTVNFMVEVCAMPGFEFACPTSSLMAPVPASGTVAVSFQSGITPLDVSPNASQECIGEVVKSVKSIIMMPDYVTTDVAGATIALWTLDPWFKPNSPTLATPMPTTTAALYFAARSSRMAELYSYVRGSTLYSVSKDRTGSLTAVFSYKPEGGGSTPSTNGSFYDRGLNPLGTSAYPEVLETGRCVIPTYSNLPRIPLDVRDFNFGGARSVLNDDVWLPGTTQAVPRLTVRNNTAASARILLGRAAADDAVCSQFVGPPPCIVLNVLATVNPYALSGISAEF
jgi:hypothetical protein